MRKKIILACEICHSRNYATTKNSLTSIERIEMKKYCRTCDKHTLHKETK